MADDVSTLILEADSSSIRTATHDIEALSRKGADLEKSLTREVALFGKTGRAAAARYDTERGALSALEPAQKRNIVALAQQYDRMERNERMAKRMGIALGLAATVAAGFVLKEMIQNTIEAEQVQAQLAARLRSTGGAAGLTLTELNKMAKGLQNVTTFGDEAIGTAQSVLLTFTKIGREAFPQALEQVLNLSVALGTDLNSAALQVGKALNDPIKGMTALSRAGVQFTEGQKKVVAEMVKTGDMAGAQKIILKELDTQMGGSAKAARNTLGGALSALKERFGDLLEGDTGSDGIKGTVEAINNLSDSMNDPAVQKGFQAIVNGTIGAIGALMDFVGWMDKAIDKSSEWMAIAAGGLGSGAKTSAKRGELRDVEAEMRARANGTIGFGGRIARGWAGAANVLGAGTISGSSDQELAARAAKLRSRIELDEMLGLDNQAKRPPKPEATKPTKPTSADYESPDEEADRAAKAAQKLAETLAKQRKEDLAQLKASLRTEEEAIQASYEERQRTIEQTTKEGSAEREELTQKSVALRDKELAELKASQGRELEDLRLSLRSEEEVIEESYANRMRIIDENSTASEEAKAKLRAKVEEDRRSELDALRAAEEEKLNVIRQSYMTEEEEMISFHERKKQEILDAAFKTEKERQEMLRREEERFMRESADRERNRLNLMVSTAGDLFGSLSQLMGQLSQAQGKEGKKAFEMSKKLAIAQTIMKTYESATNAYASLSGIPYIGPALGAAAAAAAIAAGMANIANIKSQQYSGSYDLGGQIPAGKWGWVGEAGPEKVRGPAMVTGRKISERDSYGSNQISVQTSIYMNGDGTATTDTKASNSAGDAQTARELGNVVGAKVREVLGEEMRTGGILWRIQHG